MIALVIVAILFVLFLLLGIVIYRRTLGRGPYEGTFRGALSVASVLGLFLGVLVALATLLLVLGVRAAR